MADDSTGASQNVESNPAVAPVTDDPSGEKANTKPAKVPDEEVDWAADDDELTAPISGIDSADDTARIEVLQHDPTTPYFSANSFEELGLAEELMKGIYFMKFSKPSKIQATSLPMILSSDGEYKNLIAQAHNGSGKTASFVLGMLSRIDFSLNSTQALCLVPTRELARQIEDVILSLGKFTQVTTKLVVKATNAERSGPRHQNEKIHQHVVVGTPGKVMDLLKKRQINPTKIKVLVLDEADEMVDTQGMGDQTIRIKKLLPRAVQVLLFSATYKDEVRGLAEKLAPSANQITIKRETLSLDKIQQYYIDTGSKEERYGVLTEIYELLTLGQSIIFVNTRLDAENLTQKLRTEGHTVSVLYGGQMAPEERDRVIDEFRSGTTRVLVTTNVLSRGVDVLAVSAVINYDLPIDFVKRKADAEVYLHRIGRTGRFGRKGIAINFVYDGFTKNLLEELESYYSKKITRVEDVEALSERIQAI